MDEKAHVEAQTEVALVIGAACYKIGMMIFAAARELTAISERMQEPEDLANPTIRASLLAQGLETLNLSTRSYNAIRAGSPAWSGRNGRVSDVVTLADLVVCKPHNLLCLRNFGKKSLREVQEALAEVGLGLDMRISADVRACMVPPPSTSPDLEG